MMRAGSIVGGGDVPLVWERSAGAWVSARIANNLNVPCGHVWGCCWSEAIPYDVAPLMCGEHGQLVLASMSRVLGRLVPLARGPSSMRGTNKLLAHQEIEWVNLMGNV